MNLSNSISTLFGNRSKTEKYSHRHVNEFCEFILKEKNSTKFSSAKFQNTGIVAYCFNKQFFAEQFIKTEGIRNVFPWIDRNYTQTCFYWWKQPIRVCWDEINWILEFFLEHTRHSETNFCESCASLKNTKTKWWEVIFNDPSFQSDSKIFHSELPHRTITSPNEYFMDG